MLALPEVVLGPIVIIYQGDGFRRYGLCPPIRHNYEKGLICPFGDCVLARTYGHNAETIAWRQRRWT